MADQETDFRCYKCKKEFFYHEIITDERKGNVDVCPLCGWAGIHVIQRPSPRVLEVLRTIMED